MDLRSPLAALALLALAGGARAQTFAGVPGLAESLAGIRAQVAASKAARSGHRMGRRGFMDESTTPPTGAAAPDVSLYPVRGLDVSHWDGAIDWEKLKTAGLAFVYIKATDGTDLVDDQFSRNWAGATAAGLLKGAYHFYDFCDAGAPQGDLLVKTVPAEAGTLPPVIDLEQSKECTKMPAKAAFRKDLADFVGKVREAYGRDPILYINGSIYAAYFQGEDDPYKLWIADVSHASPVLPAGIDWALWQYGWHGHVPGVAGEVDLDAFKGTPEMLASLADGSSGVEVAFAR